VPIVAARLLVYGRPDARTRNVVTVAVPLALCAFPCLTTIRAVSRLQSNVFFVTVERVGESDEMEIGRAFSYPFQDPNWVKKLLIGIVMLVIPFVGWLILYGYILRTVRNVARGSDTPLPEWDDFGGDLVLGFKGAVAGVVWALPGTILNGCTQAFSTLASRTEDTASLSALAVASLCFGCLSFLASVATNYVVPLPLSRLAVSGKLSSAFALPDIFREVRHVGVPLLIVLVVSYGLGVVAVAGILLCIVGILATGLYAWLVQAHLWGQVRRRLSTAEAATLAPAEG